MSFYHDSQVYSYIRRSIQHLYKIRYFCSNTLVDDDKYMEPFLQESCELAVQLICDSTVYNEFASLEFMLLFGLQKNDSIGLLKFLLLLYPKIHMLLLYIFLFYAIDN